MEEQSKNITDLDGDLISFLAKSGLFLAMKPFKWWGQVNI